MDTKKEIHVVSDNVECQMSCDVDEDGVFDTKVVIDGEFWVSGEKRLEFKDKLSTLINEYRI